ncbi:uncharacterized protein LOC124896741 [Capsicum annuum]|uniref:uncharacterized protein LOC124896741 n=1 Tax=Capsicum annuum TaxID=4072 RepID=UPI001FB11BA6|nr:uncharacterized protein LOC124896741 [Capsicum annuum]
MLQLHDEIMNFRQLNGKPLYEVWARFNRKIMHYPNHEVSEKMLLQIFYWALDPLNKTMVDNESGGSLMKLTYHEASNLLAEVTKQNRGCHTLDTEVPKGSPTTFVINKEQRNKDKEREKNMAKIMTQLDLLMKLVMVEPIKAVNVMASKAYDDEEAKNLEEEIWYLAYYLGSSRPTYKRQDGNNGGSINPDKYKIKDVLTRILMKVEEVEGENVCEKEPNVEPMNVKTKVVVESKESPMTSQSEEYEKESVEMVEELVKNDKLQDHVLPSMQVPPLFTKRLKRKEENDKLKKFMTKLSNFSINIPQLESIQDILEYAKLMKKLMSKKKLVGGDPIEVTHGCSAIMSNEMAKKKDLGLNTHIPISMKVLMAERSIKKLVGVSFDVLVKVDKFILLEKFVVLDCDMDQEVPIIIGRPFLATERIIVDLELGEMRFRVHDGEMSFRVVEMDKQPMGLKVVSVIGVEDEEVKNGSLEAPI